MALLKGRHLRIQCFQEIRALDAADPQKRVITRVWLPLTKEELEPASELYFGLRGNAPIVCGDEFKIQWNDGEIVPL
jgi:hypothetical protein